MATPFPEGPTPDAPAAPPTGAPATSPPPEASSAGPWEHPPDQRPRSLRPAKTVGAVGAVALILAVRVFTGVLPLFHSASHPTAVTFDTARSLAQPAAASAPGAPWMLVLGGAADTVASASVNLTAPLGSGCPLIPIGSGVPTGNVTVPGFSGSFSSGASPFWFLGYRNATDAALLVTVISGSASAAGTIPSGSSCTVLLPFLGSVDSGVVDSSSAATVALGAGGTAYTQAHPNASMAMVLVGGISIFGVTRPPTWVFEFSTCPPSGASGGLSGPQPLLNVTVNAQTGDLLSTANSTTTCAGSSGNTPLGSAFALSSPVGAAVGTDHWYNFSVQAAGGGLTFGNLSPEVLTSAGLLVTLPSGSVVNAYGISGTLLATYSFASPAHWTSGASVAVVAGDLLSLNSPGMSLSGDTLAVLGQGSFSGEITVPIP